MDLTQARTTVYPRVCGGNNYLADNIYWYGGLSPRVRGKRPAIREWNDEIGSIPACAGETDASFRPCTPDEVYPRVCGGNVAKTR